MLRINPSQVRPSLSHVNTMPAASAKSLQSCPTLCSPTDGSPPGSPSPGFSRQEPWSGLLFPSPAHACMLSRFSRVQLCATPRTAAHQAPPSTGLSRQEYWSGLPFPSPNAKTGIGFLRPEALYHLNTEGWTHPSPPGPLTGAWGSCWRPAPTLHWQPFSRATPPDRAISLPFHPVLGHPGPQRSLTQGPSPPPDPESPC